MYRDVSLLKHSERIKSELIVASKLLAALDEFQDQELEGALKMLENYFHALESEIGIALNSTRDLRFGEVLDLVSSVNPADYDASMDKIARAVSITTTIANEAYQSLFGSGRINKS